MTSENAKAKALLEQAGDMLSEAYGLAEDGTDKHETIGSALDDLAFVMHQMWPDENSEPWQDGSGPMDHAADCLMFCMEVTGEEDGTHSTELVEQAEAHVWAAAMLLWGGEWKATMDGRIQAMEQAMAAACNDIVAEAREAADNYARMEYAEPSRQRDWGMYIPDIDEPTGAALHLLGAVANLDYYRLATEGTATSDGIERAMDHIESAVDILWPETDEATDEDREEEEHLFNHRIDRAIDDAKHRAKVTAPQSAEEAADNLYDVVNDVATALVAMRLYEDVNTEHFGQLFGGTLVKAARALHYLNGGTFADRDHTAKEPDYAGADKMLAEIRGYVRNLGMGSTDMAEVMALGGPAHRAAESLAHMHATFEHVMNDPDTTEENREALKAVNAKARAMIAEIYALCPSYHGTATAESATTDGESLDGIPYVEVGYEDGSKTRITGCFGTDALADVARLMAYRNAGEDASARA